MSEHQQTQSIGSMMQIETKEGFCQKHGPYTGTLLFGRLSACPSCVKEDLASSAQQSAKEQAAARREARNRATVYNSGVPDRFKSKTFDDYEAETEKQQWVLKVCRAYAARFDERFAVGGGLVLCGKPGTGKTHLSTSICNHLTAQGRSALFASVMTAVRRVNETYQRGSTETMQQALARFFEPDLLVLDEVGLQRGSDNEYLVLYEIINGRYERVKPTILISNLDEAAMTQFVGDRVMDRMREGGGVVLAFDWESKRKDVKTASRDMPAWVSAK